MFSKTHTIFFGQFLLVSGERLNSRHAMTDGACNASVGFHGTAQGRDRISRCSGKSGSYKKVVLLRLVLRPRGEGSKIAI